MCTIVIISVIIYICNTNEPYIQLYRQRFTEKPFLQKIVSMQIILHSFEIMHTDRTVLGSYIMPVGNFTWDINCIHLYSCRSFCISGPLKCGTWVLYPGVDVSSGHYGSIPWPVKLNDLPNAKTVCKSMVQHT